MFIASSFHLRSLAFALSIEEARKAFEGALEDENKTELLLDNLSGTLSDPVLIAYRAATEALMGKFSYLPWNKYSWCKQSMTTFREAVAADPGNIEIRYLRIAIQINLPSILNMSGDIVEDKKNILQNLDKSNNPAQQNKIASFLLNNVACTDTEKFVLKKY
ncbi:MAG: hypothetical protein IPF81_01625 [Bacteroidetes bacterium]|nr:hypothetical protein [Bacteroidota bacterium]